MQQYLHKYFSLYKKIALPGIGSFCTETKPVQLDFINKTLYAPVHVILYKEEDTLVDEKFYDFLSKETGVNETNAIENFNEFTKELRSQLESKGIIHLQGVGTLFKNDKGYSFDEDNTIQTFFPDAVAERVIRQNTKHNVKVGEQHKTSTEMQEQLLNKEVKKERWWIAALILGVAGVAAIVFYYLFKK